MSMMKAILVASVLAGASVSAGHAADLMAPPPAMPDVASSSWDGFYAGFGLGYDSWHGAFASNDYQVTAKLGVNHSIDNFVLGAELYGTAYYVLSNGAVQWLAGIDGRAGFALADTALLYGTAGVYYDGNYGPQATYGTLGAGIEFAVADGVSLDLRYTRATDLDTPSYFADEIAATANFHF